MNSTMITDENNIQTKTIPLNGLDHSSTVRSSSISPATGTRELLIVIIDNRALDRQCLARCITATRADVAVLTVDSVEEWRRRDEEVMPAAILLNIGSTRMSDRVVAEEIQTLASEFAAPIVILADSDDPAEIVRALECGAKGYIPSSVNIDVCIEAIALAMAGGIFVPASSLLSMRHVLNTAFPAPRPLSGMFTVRQTEVVDALRRGKANKIIAYELNMRESTVKVHVRNIMRKVKATNRTEVAYKINDLFPMDIQPTN